MRLLGLALLLLGFATMNWKTMQARDIAYGAAGAQVSRMPKQESYDRNDMMLSMIRVAMDVWGRTTTTFYFSGVAMLVGGLLTAFGTKSQKLKKRKAQPGTAPNGGPAPPVGNSGVGGGPPSVS